MHEEVERRLNLGEACSASAQNTLVFSVLSKNAEIKIDEMKILSSVLHGCITQTVFDIRS
jgi:hypothetical protein